MTSLLITGGAGWIGSVFCLEAKKHGITLTVVDDLSTGHKEAIVPGVDFFQCSLLDQSALRSIFASRRIDAVVHFGAKSLVGESVEKPDLYYRNNLEGSLTLLREMQVAKVENLIFSSTAATYGEPRAPLTEDHPTQPINPYGRSKLAVEGAIQSFCEATRQNSAGYRLRATVFRYYNVAGSGVVYSDGTPAHPVRGEVHDPETHLIPNVFKAALMPNSSPLKVFGNDYPTADGTCIRDYVHVVDLANAHLLGLNALQSAAPGTFEVFNVGTGSGHSVMQVIEECRRVTGAHIAYAVAPRRAGDPASLVAVADKIKSRLNWSARFSDLPTMVKHAWEFFKNHPNGYQKAS